MKKAFLDIDTQIDFLFPSGALYVRGAEKIIPVIAKLNRFAMHLGLPLVSTACAHREDDPEFQHWPPHCVRGTVGQQKPQSLMVGQHVFEKQSTDLFASPDAESMIANMGAGHFTIYGVVTEICVLAAAFGLLRRDYQVTVVSDAIQALDHTAAERFLAELRERGGHVASSNEIVESD